MPRHEFDREFAARQATDFEYLIERSFAGVEQQAQRTADIMSKALARTGYQSVADPACAEGPTWESFTLAMQAGSAVWEAVRATEGVVECRLDTRTVPIPAAGPQHWATAGLWLRSLWLAMVCRERERTDRLCTVPVELIRQGDPELDDYVWDWVLALQTFWRREPGHVETFHRALEATDPERLRWVDQEFMFMQLFPPMKMFSYLLTEEPDKFAEALEEAVDLHRRYWTKNAERAADPDGLIALGPLAVASLAIETGVPVDIDTPYLPANLLSGAWVGQFRT